MSIYRNPKQKSPFGLPAQSGDLYLSDFRDFDLNKRLSMASLFEIVRF